MSTPTRHKFPWSEREDQYVRARRQAGASVEAIAEECERTPNAISLRLIELGSTAPMPLSGEFAIMRLGRQLGKLRFFKPQDAENHIRSMPIEKRRQFAVVQVLKQSEMQF